MAKQFDEKERRCRDCIFLQKKKCPERNYGNKLWICSVCNIEIHHVTDEECHVLSEDYG